MDSFYIAVGILLLLNVGVSLIRVVRGPSREDRMMGAQLIGTGGVAILVVLSLVEANAGVLDVALLLALLAAFAAVAFVKSHSSDGAGDPEAET